MGLSTSVRQALSAVRNGFKPDPRWKWSCQSSVVVKIDQSQRSYRQVLTELSISHNELIDQWQKRTALSILRGNYRRSAVVAVLSISGRGMIDP